MKEKRKSRFVYRPAGRNAPPGCTGCVWNEYIRCGVDFCVLPGCVKEGGGSGKASDG